MEASPDGRAESENKTSQTNRQTLPQYMLSNHVPIISKFPIPTQTTKQLWKTPHMVERKSEDKTSVTDLLLVQKRYVTDAGPQLTSFGPKMLRH